MTRPLLLDLFCGAGGAAMGYHRAGFDILGVDIKPQPNYPFEFIQGDALEVGQRILKNRQLASRPIVAGHASPPCQIFTAYRRKGHGVGDGYSNIIPATRSLLQAVGLPYIIENVMHAGPELYNPILLCGSMFNLDVQRHRLFESNFPISTPACNHKIWTPRFPPATNRTNLRKTVEIGVWRIPLAIQQRAMEIDWTTLLELSQAIPPSYTEHIGYQLISKIKAAA